MSDLHKFISDVGITFTASIICTLLGFPITILLGRFLGADDLGLYKMVSTIFGTFILFANLGIPTAIIKYVAEFKDNEKKIGQIVSACLITSILLGIASFILIYLSADLFANIFHMHELSGLLKILAFAFPFSIVNSTLFGLLNGLREMGKNAGISIIQNVSLLIITFLLVTKYDVVGAVMGIVFSSVLTTMLLVSVQKISNLTFSDLFKTTVQIINFGSKTLLSNLINLINYQADILMIGYFMTKTDVGIYSIAVTFAKIIWILPDSVQRITYPLISEYHAKKMNDSVELLADRCMKYSCLYLVLSSTFLVFFGKQIMDFIFGAEFEPAYVPLNVLLVGTIIYGMTKSVGSIFASVGKVDLVYKIPLASAIINVILNALLIPVYGMSGGAFATSFSLIVSMALFLHYMRSLLEITFDFWWYFKVFGISSLLIVTYFVSPLTNYLIVGSILIILEFIIFYKFFVYSENKKQINKIIGDNIKKYRRFFEVNKQTVLDK